MTSNDIYINYTREAFKNPVNLVGLLIGSLTAVLVSNFGGHAGVILTAVFGIELVYLGAVPKLPGFRKRLEIKKLKEYNSINNEKDIFHTLDSASQKKFLVLKRYSALIRENFKKVPYTSQGLTDNLIKKTEELLGNYLRQLDLIARYSMYINSTVENSLKQEIVRLIEEVKTLESPQLVSSKTRRISILQKRLQKFKLARERYLVSETQMETIDDAVRYIYEQTLTFSNPDEISFQLDSLITEVEETASIISTMDVDLSAEFDETGEAELDFDAILEEISGDVGKIIYPAKKQKN